MGVLLALVHDVEGMLWFTGIILGARALRGYLARRSVQRAVDAGTGAVLVGFGLKLGSSESVKGEPAVIDPVVDVAWVQQRLGRVVLADSRYYLDGRRGRDAYDAGHLPGAIFVDVDRDLAAHAEPEQGRHPLPTPEAFADAMGALGLNDDDVVVAYDDAGGTMAARLVWMLRATGRDAALLDGGLGAWPGDLDVTATKKDQTQFPVRAWNPALLADVDDATSAANVVLDARQPERFRGDTEPIDPKAGHIPGARNVSCRENVDATGHFLPADRLRDRFAAAGVTPDSSVVSYCGSGVTACHNLIALEHAGFAPGRLYPGSWSQYCSTNLPVATGD